jgi:hypothetical protein
MESLGAFLILYIKHEFNLFIAPLFGTPFSSVDAAGVVDAVDCCKDIAWPIDVFLGCRTVGVCLMVLDGDAGLIGDAGEGAGVDPADWLVVCSCAGLVVVIGVVFSSVFAAFDSTRCFNPFI